MGGHIKLRDINDLLVHWNMTVIIKNNSNYNYKNQDHTYNFDAVIA